MQITPYSMNWNWTDSVVSLATSPFPEVLSGWKQIAAKVAALVAYYSFIPLAYLWLIETVCKGSYSLASRSFAVPAPQNGPPRSVRFAPSPMSTEPEGDEEIGGQPASYHDTGDAQSLYAGPLRAKMLDEGEEVEEVAKKKKDSDKDSEESFETVATGRTYVTGGAHSAILNNDHFLSSSSSSSSAALQGGQKKFRVCFNPAPSS